MYRYQIISPSLYNKTMYIYKSIDVYVCLSFRPSAYRYVCLSVNSSILFFRHFLFRCVCGKKNKQKTDDTSI